MTQPLHISNALQALPLEAPGHSLWPQLQEHIPKQASWPKWSLAMAASAALAVAVLQLQAPALPDGAIGMPVAAAGNLQQLMDRSALLENDFYALQDDALSSATVIAANLSIEDRLAAIDSQLMAEPGSKDSAALWQERIDLLSQGVSLNRTNAAYNADGRYYDLALASIN
ncbi:MAG: hypothetical protein KAZ45_01300 [Arenimonas sp.]|nr:hypothetical protein [Arenimonas sp.]MBP7917081.1 hypothetical protein [Arenimonas sp.]